MNLVNSNLFKTIQFTREIHLSSSNLRFAVNEARRKQSRRNWRKLAKSLGLNPRMANATIKKEAQIRGAIPGKQFMLEQWAFQKTITQEERYLFLSIHYLFSLFIYI